MKPTAETIALALKIADSGARADIECQCRSIGPKRPWKWDLRTADAGSLDDVMDAARYLELRGRIHRDPAQPYIVSFPDLPE